MAGVARPPDAAGPPCLLMCTQRFTGCWKPICRTDSLLSSVMLPSEDDISDSLKADVEGFLAPCAADSAGGGGGGGGGRRLLPACAYDEAPKLVAGWDMDMAGGAAVAGSSLATREAMAASWLARPGCVLATVSWGAGKCEATAARPLPPAIMGSPPPPRSPSVCTFRDSACSWSATRG